MSGLAPASHSQPGSAQTPAAVWHGLLRPDVELAPAFLDELNARMRAERLTFGERIHCPFLRPFFLSAEDEQRVRTVAEAIAALGERVVKQSLADPRLLAQSALLAALGALPREQRETFLLHEETGLTIEEIARVTDVGIETVKSRLRYAIRKLKKSLLAAQIEGTQPQRPRRDLKDTLINGSA